MKIFSGLNVPIVLRISIKVAKPVDKRMRLAPPCLPLTATGTNRTALRSLRNASVMEVEKENWSEHRCMYSSA